MANTVALKTILDGPRNTIVLVNIVGDGSGEETDTVIFDRSSFVATPAGSLGVGTIVDRVHGYASGVTATLEFDATADGVLCRLPADYFDYCWGHFGGIPSSKIVGAGATGDILITTGSLGSGDFLTFTLECRKLG